MACSILLTFRVELALPIISAIPLITFTKVSVVDTVFNLSNNRFTGTAYLQAAHRVFDNVACIFGSSAYSGQLSSLKTWVNSSLSYARDQLSFFFQ